MMMIEWYMYSFSASIPFYDNDYDYDDTIRSSLSTIREWGRLVNW